jgi:hypothetical protein
MTMEFMALISGDPKSSAGRVTGGYGCYFIKYQPAY